MYIRKFKAFNLYRETFPVDIINERILGSIDEMFKLMYKFNGIGLAANQVGLPDRLFVSNFDKPRVFINPYILSYSAQEETLGKEGCLSFPGLTLKVWRPRYVQIKYKDINGKIHVETFADYHARVIQHEIDHLDGITFDRRVGPFQKAKVLIYKLKNR
jgi:peptide deformylase